MRRDFTQFSAYDRATAMQARSAWDALQHLKIASKRTCLSCAHIANVSPDSKLWACTRCGLIQSASELAPASQLIAETKAFDQATFADHCRIEAERATMALQSRSTRALDRGKQPIEDSPLFGAPAQQTLF